MDLHGIPPVAIANGVFSIAAAVVTGILSWRGGEKTGKEKVYADYVEAIERAAKTVIDRMDKQLKRSEEHEAACVEELNTVKAQIAELMSLGIPPYRPGSTGNLD